MERTRRIERPEIEVMSGSLKGKIFVLPPVPSSCILGRGEGCTIQFDPEQERAVGRQHARIDHRVDGVVLVDLNSRNGTFLDGKPVTGPMQLLDGDQFQVGEGGPFVRIWLPESMMVAPTIFVKRNDARAQEKQKSPEPIAPTARPRPDPDAITRPGTPGFFADPAVKVTSLLDNPSPGFMPAGSAYGSTSGGTGKSGASAHPQSFHDHTIPLAPKPAPVPPQSRPAPIPPLPSPKPVPVSGPKAAAPAVKASPAIALPPDSPTDAQAPVGSSWRPHPALVREVIAATVLFLVAIGMGVATATYLSTPPVQTPSRTH